MQSVKAEITLTGKGRYLSLEEMDSLAYYKKSCDLAKADLEDTTLKLESCFQRGAPVTKFWAKPQFVIGGFIVSFGIGALIAASLVKK